MRNNSRTLVLFSMILVFSLVTAAVPLLSPTFVTASPDTGDTWTTPLNITLVYNNTVLCWDDRAIAVDTQGNIHAVYMSPSDNEIKSIEIYYATNAGGNWSWANISKMNNSDIFQISPVIAIDNIGVIHIAWVVFDQNSMDMDIYYCNNSGGTWNTPYNVTSTGGTNNLEVYPCMVVDSSNTIHMVYAFSDAIMGGKAWIRYVTYDGSAWSTPITLTNQFDGMAAKKSIDISPSGQIFAAYSAYNGSSSNSEIFLVNKTGTTWGTPVNVTKNTALGIEDGDPSIDIDSAGNIHLAWESNNSGDYGVNYMVYSSGSWSTPVFINATRDNAQYLSIITDINNKAHIAFSQEESGVGEIYYTNNTSGSFGNPVNITKTATGDEVNPHLILDQSGYGHIIFNNQTDVSQVYYISSTESLAPPSPPSISGPADIEYIIGEADPSLTWKVTSASYTNGNYTLYLNGSVIDNGTWTNNTNLDLSIDGLDQVGTANVTLAAEDTYGNTISDQVSIEVSAASAGDLTIPLIIGGVVGVIVVVGVAVYILKIRKP